MFDFCFVPDGVEHHPVFPALGVGGHLVGDFVYVTGFDVWAMHFVHLFFYMVVVEVALLCGKSAVVGVTELRFCFLVAECRKDFVTDDFVEALCCWWECFEVVVVEGSGWCVVEDVEIRFVEDEENGICFSAVW